MMEAIVVASSPADVLEIAAEIEDNSKPHKGLNIPIVSRYSF
jgi:hypothetical protein